MVSFEALPPWLVDGLLWALTWSPYVSLHPHCRRPDGCVFVCPNFLFFKGHQSDWISTHPKDHTLTESPPHRPWIYTQPHSEVLKVKTSTCEIREDTEQLLTTLKLEFHIIFKCPKRLSFFFFSMFFKHLKLKKLC